VSSPRNEDGYPVRPLPYVQWPELVMLYFEKANKVGRAVLSRDTDNYYDLREELMVQLRLCDSQMDFETNRKEVQEVLPLPED
jgi:hypothetical protein